MDRLTEARRSWNMSRIKSRNTGPEKIVRSVLHGMGYRFRLNYKGLPCSPDIVLPRLKTVILVHGCFWHRHAGCKLAYTPKTRVEFWQKKFEENMARDIKNEQSLAAAGWKVLTVWQCQTKDRSYLESLLSYELAGKQMNQLREEASQYDTFS
ncbi:MAG: DNA mismatch endonuclease vsr [uncultured bacterium]|nr:MAG: DNA mismatch endonuclease vsr [uncultured bacterium]